MPKAPTFLGLIGWTYVPIPPNHGILATESNFTFDMRRDGEVCRIPGRSQARRGWALSALVRVRAPARTLTARGVLDIGTNHVR
jgi:hypothetical protein